MSVLKEFSLKETIEARDAKHDKITLHVQHRSFTASAEQIGEFRNHLAVPPPSAAFASRPQFGRLFNRPRLHWQAMHIRSSRRGHGAPFPLPLFSGDYRFKSSAGGSLLLTTLELSLNPTRFLRNQNPATFRPPRRNDPRFDECNHVVEGGERSLDNNDNWLPNTNAFRHLHDARVWPRNLRTYLRGVLNTIDADVLRAATHEAVQMPSEELIGLQRFSLREVETYFDFKVAGNTTLGLVASLERSLRTYGDLGVTARDYPTEIDEWTGISRVLKLKVRPGVTLKVYAKTDERIRFEVTHTMSKARFWSNVYGLGSVRKRYSFPTLDGVFQLVGRIEGECHRNHK